VRLRALGVRDSHLERREGDVLWELPAAAREEAWVIESQRQHA